MFVTVPSSSKILFYSDSMSSHSTYRLILVLCVLNAHVTPLFLEALILLLRFVQKVLSNFKI